jgi:hypothetical protein
VSASSDLGQRVAQDGLTLALPEASWALEIGTPGFRAEPPPWPDLIVAGLSRRDEPAALTGAPRPVAP